MGSRLYESLVLQQSLCTWRDSAGSMRKKQRERDKRSNFGLTFYNIFYRIYYIEKNEAPKRTARGERKLHREEVKKEKEDGKWRTSICPEEQAKLSTHV